jgi:hypothetical protein
MDSFKNVPRPSGKLSLNRISRKGASSKQYYMFLISAKELAKGFEVLHRPAHDRKLDISLEVPLQVV